jgi:hypothetical protein
MAQPKNKKKRAAPPPPPVRKTPPRRAPAETPQRDERRAQAEKAKRRDAQRKRLAVIGAIVVVVAIVVAWITINQRQDAELREALTSGTCTTDDESDPTRPAGQNHVQNPTYAVNPPAGGDHLVSNASSGVYAGADVPADGLLVHSLEHGYIIFWHTPEISEEDKATLATLEEESPGDIIVAERPGMPVPVAATAWGERLLCQDVEAEPLRRFVSEYVGKGPEDVPRG